MAQAKTLTQAEIEQLLSHINTCKYAARNRSMMLLTHWACLRIGEVAGSKHWPGTAASAPPLLTSTEAPICSRRRWGWCDHLIGR